MTDDPARLSRAELIALWSSREPMSDADYDAYFDAILAPPR